MITPPRLWGQRLKCGHIIGHGKSALKHKFIYLFKIHLFCGHVIDQNAVTRWGANHPGAHRLA
jgi:hypothetical protein